MKCLKSSWGDLDLHLLVFHVVVWLLSLVISAFQHWYKVMFFLDPGLKYAEFSFPSGIPFVVHDVQLWCISHIDAAPNLTKEQARASPYYTNDIESNKILKQHANGKSSSLPEFVDKMKELLTEECSEIEKAVALCGIIVTTVQHSCHPQKWFKMNERSNGMLYHMQYKVQWCW